MYSSLFFFSLLWLVVVLWWLLYVLSFFSFGPAQEVFVYLKVEQAGEMLQQLRLYTDLILFGSQHP